VSSWPIRCIKVLLREPDGPTIAANSPFRILKFALSSVRNPLSFYIFLSDF
jgi:hypothetical protein